MPPFGCLWKLSIVLNLVGGARDLEAALMLITRLEFMSYFSLRWLNSFLAPSLLEGLWLYPPKCKLLAWPGPDVVVFLFEGLTLLSIFVFFMYGNYS